MTMPPPSQFDQVGFGVSAFVEVLKDFVETLAIIVGGFWTYLNYFKGRTYRSRLECNVEPSIVTHPPRSMLKVVVKVKNVGLSKVSIQQEGTALQLHRALTPKASPPWPCQAMWENDPALFDVFKEHTSVEPSEPIEDQVLVELPRDKASAYKLTLTVRSGKEFWTAKSIVQATREDGHKGVSHA
jgi:hypothetical protein